MVRHLTPDQNIPGSSPGWVNLLFSFSNLKTKLGLFRVSYLGFLRVHPVRVKSHLRVRAWG